MPKRRACGIDSFSPELANTFGFQFISLVCMQSIMERANRDTFYFVNGSLAVHFNAFHKNGELFTFKQWLEEVGSEGVTCKFVAKNGKIFNTTGIFCGTALFEDKNIPKSGERMLILYHTSNKRRSNDTRQSSPPPVSFPSTIIL